VFIDQLKEDRFRRQFLDGFEERGMMKMSDAISSRRKVSGNAESIEQINEK